MNFDATAQTRFYFYTGIICVINNSIAIYLLIFKSGNIGTYRYYMLYFQIMCILLDIHLTLLVAPITYFPALIAVSNGIYSKWFSIRTHFQINMILSLIVLQICSLLCSFMRKHQSVAMIDQKRIMDPVKKYLIKGFLHIPPILVCVSFALSNLDKSEETKIAKEKFPYLLPLLILPNVEMYSDSSIPIILTLIFMIFTFVLYCSLILYFYFQILYMLHGHRKFMAAKTYSKHISAMFSLVAQLFVLIVWLAIPVGLLLADVILQVTGFELIGNLLICLFSTHSIVSTIVLVATFPAFRRIIFCQRK
ncbi:Serpentine Receptor, class H [Caenorhabditis elegans]|uniref:Serpentine Receptor, class H n=1 Tax=Caenorhabditis elegans TaxID=6239 RepID=Q3V5K7_CAEEL|nr:Serpentine Receptor, class H [Caenorhabditis elegans]CCD64286.2 Serpentine Receptor, class H [Caenorhabditis elegans]|eukprot:NP_001033523.2 Uncharacterized protein CELE_ZK105.8 [Caenorhabditis elegans]